MNSQNFPVNSHQLKFVSLCNDLRTNLSSNHADEIWLTVVIIALHYHLLINCNFMLKPLQYRNYITIVMQIKLMLLLLLLTTGLVTNFSGCITKDSFPSTPPNFLLIPYNFIKVLQISTLHEIEAVYQFWSSINPMESNYPPLPSPLLRIPYPFLLARDFFRSHFPQTESLFTGYPFVACYAG